MSTYSKWFKRATRESPYEYQRLLAEATEPPGVLDVPTGCGKTQAILGAWMYQREVLKTGPRRLVYALPMRSLVEQTADVARKMRDALGHDAQTLPIHVLMGGESPKEGDWRLRPDRDQILVGTIDLLLSRAINRGYGESRYAWPVAFGLLNADCRWVFDEVQLMGPARTTSLQLDGLRDKLGTILPCQSMWASATLDPERLSTVDRPSPGATLSLPDADRRGRLKTRLAAEKTLRRLNLEAVVEKDRPEQIAAAVIAEHRPRTLTLVVLNRVGNAQSVYKALRSSIAGEDQPQLLLLHSRFRRDARRALADELATPLPETGRIVVATQVVEAGVDLSAATLFTETAPFSSIVQRLGRCNRDGKAAGGGRVIWLDSGAPDDGTAGQKAAAPYQPADLEATRSALLELEGQSLSPDTLSAITVEETPDDPEVLRRRDLVDLFDTSADLSGTDIDVAPFIREDDQSSVFVFFREIDDEGKPVDENLPDRSELVQVPLGELKRRKRWRLDHVEGEWVSFPGMNTPPGSTVLLDAVDGGYSEELGWDPSIESPVTVIAVPQTTKAEDSGIESDDLGERPVELLQHLDDVHRQTQELVAILGIDHWADAVTEAAALHDIGKAHPAFQTTLRDAMKEAGLDVDLSEAGPTWAKSGVRGKGHRERRYLRHELAGALMVLVVDGDRLPLSNPALTTYLIAAHHGKVRLSIRPAAGEAQPDAGRDKLFALGIVDGDRIPSVESPLGTVPETTLDLACMSLGGEVSWTAAALDLRDAPDLGPFRLGFLEAILRVADWRGSENA